MFITAGDLPYRMWNGLFATVRELPRAVFPHCSGDDVLVDTGASGITRVSETVFWGGRRGFHAVTGRE